MLKKWDHLQNFINERLTSNELNLNPQWHMIYYQVKTKMAEFEAEETHNSLKEAGYC